MWGVEISRMRLKKSCGAKLYPCNLLAQPCGFRHLECLPKAVASLAHFECGQPFLPHSASSRIFISHCTTLLEVNNGSADALKQSFLHREDDVNRQRISSCEHYEVTPTFTPPSTSWISFRPSFVRPCGRSMMKSTSLSLTPCFCTQRTSLSKRVSLRGVADIHSLRDEDMVYVMGMQSKELHKLCGRLREDRFLSV
jgi:hypothetical protein